MKKLLTTLALLCAMGLGVAHADATPPATAATPAVSPVVTAVDTTTPSTVPTRRGWPRGGRCAARGQHYARDARRHPNGRRCGACHPRAHKGDNAWLHDIGRCS